MSRFAVIIITYFLGFLCNYELWFSYNVYKSTGCRLMFIDHKVQQMSLRGNQIWAFLMIATMIGFALADASALAVLVAFLMGGAVLMSLLRSAAHHRQRRERLAMPKNMSQAAQIAQNQAMHHPDFSIAYSLLDIGLLLDEYQRNGLYVRRVKSVSTAGHALRPYVILGCDKKGEPSPILLRFEMIDHQGQLQYVYETEHFLRFGENAIVPNYRLPLKGNAKLGSSGQWLLNVWVDGGLVASHQFMVYATEKTTNASADGEVPLTQVSQEPMPISLEEVLAQQNSGAKL